MLTVQQRDLIAAAFGSAVDEVVIEHYPALTQEHQLVSRIAQRIEDRLDGISIVGANVRVVVQEFPDRGPNSLEKRIGADIFVSVSVVDELSKGFLVQAKWRDAPEPDVYALQCERMMSTTSAAYGWEFGPTGTRVFRAKAIARRFGGPGPGRRSPFEFGWTLATMMKRLLICREGDKRLGIPLVPDRRAYLRSMLGGALPQYAVEITVAS